MANSVQLTNFTDFDRLLTGKNFLVTILGSAAAFALGYFQISVPIPVISAIPYNITFVVALMILVSVYTSNIASASLVVLIGSLGLKGPEGTIPDFFLGFVLVNLILCCLLAYFSNKLRLVMRWTRFYHLFAIVFAIMSIGTGYMFQSNVSRYDDAGVDVGSGGDLGTGLGLPVFDIAVLVGIIVVILISTLLLRGQIQLTSSGSRKYTLFGLLFITLGHLATFVPLLLFSNTIDQATFAEIAQNEYHAVFLSQLFFYGDKFGVLGSFANIFFVMPVSIAFICIGINLKSIGEHRGNLEGMRGGSDFSLLAAPLAVFIYFVYASSYIQNFIDPDGLFISTELFPIFAVAIWSVYLINQILARIVILVIDMI